MILNQQHLILASNGANKYKEKISVFFLMMLWSVQ